MHCYLQVDFPFFLFVISLPEKIAIICLRYMSLNDIFLLTLGSPNLRVDVGIQGFLPQMN